MMVFLKDLPEGKFVDGAVARILAPEFWSRREAPTFEKYASAWLRAAREHIRPNLEWAFLSERANKPGGADWKKFRTAKAITVMKILNQISR
jgi:hypothetical protein